MQVPTVKVARPDHPDGYTVINESDMTADDVLYDPSAVKTEKPAPKKKAAK